MNYKKQINSSVTCEVSHHGNVKYFAKLEDGQWVAVLGNGSLDGVEISRDDFEAILETLSTIGANIRFTNHSAA